MNNKIPFNYRLARALGHFVDFKGKDRLCRLLADPDRNFNQEFEAICYDGSKFTGNFRYFYDWITFVYGGPELGLARTLAFIGQNLQHSLFLDIGANAGYHTLVCANAYKSVWAFECHPVVLNLLQQRTVGLENVIIIGQAVADRCTELTLNGYDPGQCNIGTSSIVTREENHNNPIKVSATTLDSYLPQLKGFDHIVVKVDVEDAEHLVLSGASKLIAQVQPVLFIESQDIRRLESFVSLGYNIYSLHHWYRRLCVHSAEETGNDDYALIPTKYKTLWRRLLQQNWIIDKT